MADREALGIKTAFLSDSFAAYRCDALADVGGFPDVPACEDMYVGAKLLQAGYTIVYAAEAQVYHSHGQQGEAIEGSEGNVFLRGARIPFVMSWEFAKRNGPTGLLLRGRDLLAILELGLLLAAVFSLLYTSYYFVLRGV